MKILVHILVHCSIFCSLASSQAFKEVNVDTLFLNTNIENSDNYLEFKTPSTLSQTITFSFPDSYGNSGEIITNNGSGSFYWSSPSSGSVSPAGVTGNIQYNSLGSFAGSNNLFWDINNQRLGINNSSPDEKLVIEGSLQIGEDGSDGLLIFYKNGGTDNTIAFAPTANMTQSTTYTLPVEDGDTDDILVTDGDGNLFWVSSGESVDCDNCDCSDGQGTGGGTDNNAGGGDSFIGGGSDNEVSDDDGFIGSGNGNENTGDDASIVNGKDNFLDPTSTHSIIGTGLNIRMEGNQAGIVSGNNNFIDDLGDFSFMGTGRDNYINSLYCSIGSGFSNTINVDSDYSVIGNGTLNFIDTDQVAGILAGTNNTIENGTDNGGRSGGVIFGGTDNFIESFSGFIGNGENNRVQSDGNYSSIITGRNHTIESDHSLIAGGINNTITGDYAMAMGQNSEAEQNYSVAIGRGATSEDEGAWVITDGRASDVISETTDQFKSNFDNGYKFYTNTAQTAFVEVVDGGDSWASSSDSALKENIINLKSGEFYSKIDQLKIKSWNYKSTEDKTIRNYGPMAQTFYRLFGKDSLGVLGSELTISSYNLTVVGILALKESQNKFDRLQKEFEKVKVESNQLDSEIESLYLRLLELENTNNLGGLHD